MGFSRQEHWSGFPFLSPGDLPHLGIKPGSHALQADSLLSELPGIPKYTSENKNKNQLLLKAGGGEERKQGKKVGGVSSGIRRSGGSRDRAPRTGRPSTPSHTPLRDEGRVPPLLCVFCSPKGVSAFLQPEAVTRYGVLGENLAESVDGRVLSQCIDSKPFHVFKNRSTLYDDLFLVSC